MANVCGEIEELIIERIRAGYPYMKTESVQSIAKAGSDLIKARIDDQAIAIQESKARCSFFSLSPERRNRIYELSLVLENSGDGGVPNCRAIRVCDVHKRRKCANKYVGQPSLSRVSRQIRNETLPVFYSMNHFAIDVVMRLAQPNPGDLRCEFDFCGGEYWLQQIGAENIRLIKHLDVCCIGAFGGFGKDDKPYKRDWAACLEQHGITIPATTAFLVKTRYWQPLDFDSGNVFLKSYQEHLITDKSLAYRKTRGTPKWNNVANALMYF